MMKNRSSLLISALILPAALLTQAEDTPTANTPAEKSPTTAVAKNRIKPPAAGDIGYVVSIGSIFVPGAPYNYAVDMQIVSHGNPFAATFNTVNVNATTDAPSAWYDVNTQLIYAPNIQTYFTGADGLQTCVLYNVYFSYQDGYWVPWQANAGGDC